MTARVLPHPVQVEVVAAKRIDVLAHQRDDVAQRLVINLMPLGAQLRDDLVHLKHVPGNNRIV